MCLKLECGLFTTFGYAVYYAALSIHILKYTHTLPLFVVPLTLKCVCILRLHCVCIFSFHRVVPFQEGAVWI